MRTASIAVAALTLGLAVVGCGDLPTPDKGADPSRPYRVVVSPQRIGPREIDRQPAGSPQRALLSWFGALQRGDAHAAASMLDPALRVDVAKVRRQRRIARNFFRYVGIGQLLDTTRAGDRATVFTTLARAWKAPNHRVNQYNQAQAFDLIRVNGRWLIADNYFLSLTAAPRRFAGS